MSEILVLAEHRNGELRSTTRELVGAALALRDKRDARVVLGLISDSPEALLGQARIEGVNEVVSIKVSAKDYEPDVIEKSVQMLIETVRPFLILAPHSVDSMGYAPAVATRTGCGFATDVFEIADGQDGVMARRAGYRQKVNIEVTFPGRATVLLTVRNGSFKAPEGSAEPIVSHIEAPPLASRVRSVGFLEPPAATDVDMTAADFILAVGRGVGEEANVKRFEVLAENLGAILGCSRPVADAGWLPKSRQVGQSGKTVSSCKLYVAMGISGAIQHLVGMKHVPTIIAVNTDLAASIFSVAHYGVVADILDLADALELELKKS
jgi:electron transfer flavoprotein alpha subunit